MSRTRSRFPINSLLAPAKAVAPAQRLDLPGDAFKPIKQTENPFFKSLRKKASKYPAPFRSINLLEEAKPEPVKPLIPARQPSLVPPQPKSKHPPFMELSGEAVSSNARLAKTLNRTTDLSGVQSHIEPGVKAGDHKAIAEIRDLVEQMNTLTPGHGDNLAKAVGLPPMKPPPATSTRPLIGGAGDDALGVKTPTSELLSSSQNSDEILSGGSGEEVLMGGTGVEQFLQSHRKP